MGWSIFTDKTFVGELPIRHKYLAFNLGPRLGHRSAVLPIKMGMRYAQNMLLHVTTDM